MEALPFPEISPLLLCRLSLSPPRPRHSGEKRGFPGGRGTRILTNGNSKLKTWKFFKCPRVCGGRSTGCFVGFFFIFPRLAPEKNSSDQKKNFSGAAPENFFFWSLEFFWSPEFFCLPEKSEATWKSG